ncbi:15382_t:CDS:2 [Funneliformis caledonium]|uniref:15382_t:CDS:1 n=1 Tax=Funneliformis caledonium TaxID=1117310 RepID=A0A9N9GSN6_9GLOM|nr:15382_t:CDS:2 [Funneliformis caledonium]
MSQQKKPHGFDGKYTFSETDEKVIPSFSEFICSNVDFIARSSTQTSNFQGLEGAWTKRFNLSAKILNIEGNSQHCKHSSVRELQLGLLAAQFLDVAKESPLKRLAKQVVKDDSNNSPIVSKTLDKNELILLKTPDENISNISDESYHPISNDPDDDIFIEIKKRINYTYN